jgi:hypothetical protein
MSYRHPVLTIHDVPHRATPIRAIGVKRFRSFAQEVFSVSLIGLYSSTSRTSLSVASPTSVTSLAASGG